MNVFKKTLIIFIILISVMSTLIFYEPIPLLNKMMIMAIPSSIFLLFIITYRKEFKKSEEEETNEY